MKMTEQASERRADVDPDPEGQPTPCAEIDAENGRKGRLHQTLSLGAGGGKGNWARRSVWSPDGLGVLSQCEEPSLFVHRLPSDAPESSHDDALHVPLPAPALCTAWYPYTTFSVPGMSCFAASVRETPVRLLDATDGRLRASYPLIDHRERHVAPHSLAFGPTGDKLYAGTTGAYTIFDVSRPGTEGELVPTTPKKSSKDGVKGILSSLAIDASAGLLAIGSLSGGLALCDLDTNGIVAQFGLGSGDAGVSQVRLTSPLLYASFRRRAGVYVWDLRGGAGEPVRQYTPSTSAAMTAQRHFFDLDVSGRWLAVGDEQGVVHVWDTHAEVSAQDMMAEQQLDQIHPVLTFSAHDDSVPSVSFHPTIPSRLLTTSGARHWVDSASHETDTDASDDEDIKEVVAHDVSLKVWDLPLS